MPQSIRVLGPFVASVDTRPIRLAGRLRAMLATLALTAGRTVPIDRLATSVWDEERLPANTRRSVQTYIARLREATGAELIETGPDGYALRAGPDNVDVVRFLRLLNVASGRPDEITERRLLSQALELWRGPPFEHVPSEWLRQMQAPRLVERHLAAVERRVDLDLAREHQLQLVAPLRELWHSIRCVKRWQHGF